MRFSAAHSVPPTSSRRRRRPFALVGVTAAVAIALTGCGGADPADEAGGDLTVGLVMNSGGSLNPYTQADPNTPLDLIYDDLVRLRDVEGAAPEYIPWLATDWDFADDFTSLSMTLRDDVTFSNGTPFNAEVVKRNFEESLKNAASYATLLGEAYAEVTGDYEVTIHYTGVHAPLTVLEYLRTPMIAPEALEDPDSLANSPIGSGPYLYDAERSTTEAEYFFTPRDDYWNDDVHQWDEVVVKQFSDLVAVLNALKGGQIDFGPVEAATAAEAESSGLELSVGLGRFSGLYFVDRDGTQVPALADSRVRQAINMAFDRQAIVDAVEYGQGEPANQALPFNDPEFADRFTFDPDAARGLLADAGYADGFDLPMASFGSPYEPILQQALADIGIRVVYEPAQATDYFADAAAGKWPVLLNIGPIGPFFASVIEQFYVSTGGYYNVLAASVPEVDELVTTYRFGDEAASAAAATEISEYLLDEAWFAVMTYPHTLWAHSPDLNIVTYFNRGFQPSLVNMTPAG